MKIHFIGIGGIGMSSLAQYYAAKGHSVYGSDLAASEVTDLLKEKGIGIAIGHYAQNIKEDFNMVVFSPAVPKNNVELQRARELGITLLSYPEALGELTRHYFTIAVSGSHGKSTTTAMIALVLQKAGLDPTVIVGTKLKEFGDSNFRMGHSNFLVIEACEYDDSFANYDPKIVVVTNIDKEHLDYFKTFANVVKAFKKFMLKLPDDGFLVANKDDLGVNKIINSQFSITNKFSIKQFSIKQKESTKIKKILKIPGNHNVSNALAALAVAKILNIKDQITLLALGRYRGSWRRFEIKNAKAGEKSITIISDYGHHPTEIAATLQAARQKYPGKKIWCIFQPHQHQRTFYLFNDFVKVFQQAPVDALVITDIYDVAGREKQTINKKTSSQELVKKIGKKHVRYLPVDKAEEFAKEYLQENNVLIIMGAGDIYKLTEKF